MKVLISGASIAGPALAYWLNQYGHQVTVVEQSPSLRPGGRAVDFKGATHQKVLERMGIFAEVQQRQTGKTDTEILGADNECLATIPGEFTGGDVEILRGDLATLLYERTSADCEYLFGDTITALREHSMGVAVTFRNAAPREFDLVVGADGIHSTVRRLAFGPEERFVRHLGHYYAVVGGIEAPVKERGTATMYNTPGRMVTVGGPKAPAMFVFASAQLDYQRDDIVAQQRIVAEKYAGMGGEIAAVVERLPEEAEFYLDSISRVAMDSYTSGRIALLGDAAYGNTLGGFGTGLAVVGAYVLAGELSKGDYRTAFTRYNDIMRQYAKIARKGNAGPFLAPSTPVKIRLRNWTFKYAFLLRIMMKMTDSYATDIELPDYPLPAAS